MPFPANGANLKLGKGSLLLAPYGTPAFTFRGNVEALTLAAETQTAEKYSSTQQAAPLIGRAVTRVSYTLTATMSEYMVANLKDFLLGSQNDAAQTLGMAATHNIDDVVMGSFYKLGARNVTNLVLQKGTVELVENVDYIANLAGGIVGLLDPGSTLVVDGDDIVATFDRPARTIQQIRIAQVASPIYELLFQADDANQDGNAKDDQLEIWKVNLAPEGELNLIGDEFGTFQVSMAVLSDAVNHAADPFGRLSRSIA